MSNAKLLNSLALIAASAIMAAAPVGAHTTIRSQANESTTEDNALRIGHTCETPEGAHIPVVAQSVVFPSEAPEITTSDGSAVAGLPAVIEQGTLAGLARAIQDRSIFRAQQPKLDALGNSIGFSGTNGALSPDVPGRVAFQFAGPRFVANSCARRLLVRVAIADICLLGSGITDSVRPGKVNMWIPENGSQFAVIGRAQNIDGIAAPARLTVNRNVTTNPLPASCGAGIDVTVTPSAADITNNLPIPGVWP